MKKEPSQKEKLFTKQEIALMVVRIAISVLASFATLACIGRI